jgi:hypothetical protein
MVEIWESGSVRILERKKREQIDDGNEQELVLEIASAGGSLVTTPVTKVQGIF